MTDPLTITISNPAICPACQRRMISKQLSNALPHEARWGVEKEAVIQSHTIDAEGRPLCVGCIAHARFRCWICKEERAGKPQESYGDPAEYLCVPCFETKTAKEWSEANRKLNEEHRWDFE